MAGLVLASSIYAFCHNAIAGALGEKKDCRICVVFICMLFCALDQTGPLTKVVSVKTLCVCFCFAAPHYSSTGELLFSGADLKTGGVLSYYHDVLYVTLFSQSLGSFFNYGWLFMISIPVYAIYALVVNVLIPAWSSNDVASPPESEADRKRQEKHARQAARAQKFASQRR